MSPEPRTAAAPAPEVSVALRRLRAGEISLDEYLDDRVEQALQPLKRFLTAEHASVVREVVRSECLHNPALSELVHRTTGIDPDAVAAAGATKA